MADLFVLGLLAHIVADWFLQSDVMAAKKSDLRSPWAWAHFACHLGCMLVVWPWLGALVVAASHALIDTRTPLVWWRRLMRQKSFDASKDTWWNVTAMQVAFWQDQCAHLAVLGGVAWALGG